MIIKSVLLSICSLLFFVGFDFQSETSTVFQGRQVYHPQLGLTSDGTLLLTWMERVEEQTADLFITHWMPGGGFAPPQRVNQARGSAHFHTLDEMRPSLSTGPNGLIALAWADHYLDVRVAMGNEYGNHFQPSVKLNQEDGKVVQTFVSVAFDQQGALHAVWLDPRRAEPMDEEPADLYYAKVVQGHVTEWNLTAGQEASVCGCCRPDIGFNPAGLLEVVFRNTGPGGYRDIFRMVQSSAGTFGAPQRYGPPLWQINGCPVSGPVVAHGQAVWRDGSTGLIRLLGAMDLSKRPKVLLAANDAWNIDKSPRRVESLRPEPVLILVPGRPAGRILQLSAGNGSILAEDIPTWCTSAAWQNGRLYLVGTLAGKLQFESRPFRMNR